MEIIAVAAAAQLREQQPQRTHTHTCEQTTKRVRSNRQSKSQRLEKNNKSFASKQRSGRRRRIARLNAARAAASVRISAKMGANS